MRDLNINPIVLEALNRFENEIDPARLGETNPTVLCSNDSTKVNVCGELMIANKIATVITVRVPAMIYYYTKKKSF